MMLLQFGEGYKSLYTPPPLSTPLGPSPSISVQATTPRYSVRVTATERRTRARVMRTRPVSATQSGTQPPQSGTVIGLFCTAVLDIMLLWAN